VMARMRSGTTTFEAVVPRVEATWPLQRSM
jgi:hypothetical protein